ncbi:MAG: two-component regulator propeller domain-containing protein [Saprospiraceae bacterium]
MFNKLTQAEGLSQTSNHAVLKDSRGFVWISSLNGLNRFDGQEVRVYKYRAGDPHSLPDNYIQSGIYEDREGNLWFSTYEALVCYVRDKDHFVSFRDTAADGRPKMGYHLAFMDKQRLLGVIVEEEEFRLFDLGARRWTKRHKLAGTTRWALPLYDRNQALEGILAPSAGAPGAYFYDLKGSYQLRFPNLRLTDAVWMGDTLLFAANQGLLTQLPNGQTTLYPTPGWLPDQLCLSKTGQVFISTISNGLWMADRNDLSSAVQFAHDPKDPLSLASNNTTSVWEDAGGGLWVGVYGIGVNYTQPSKVKFQTLDMGELFGITDREVGVHAMAEDREGRIWCSTRKQGVFVLSPGLAPLLHYSKKNPLPHTLPGDDAFFLFFDSESRCWVFTWNGLAVLLPGREQFELVEKGRPFLHGIELHDRQILLSPHEGGLVLTDGHRAPLRPVSGPSGVFTHLFQHGKGWVFACNNLSSIQVFDPANSFSLLRELPIKGEILNYYEPPGSDTLWIATQNGLVRLDLRSWQWKTYTEADGLPDQLVYSVTAGHDGLLWLSTNRGIASFQPREERFHPFDRMDGLQGMEYNSHAFLRRANGELWFGGARGIDRFRPEQVRLLAAAPKVQFTRLLVNDAEPGSLVCRNTGAVNVSEMEKLVFPYRENTLSFACAALEFSNPSKNLLRYKMEGYDADWVLTRPSGLIRYPNLPPNDYRLVVQAANSDGVWSEAKVLEIVIRKPYWQQWWFVALVFATLSGTLYGIYRYRLGQVLRIHRIRSQISDDLHDAIGSTLSNIQILIALIRQKLKKESEVTSLLGRIEEEVQGSADSLDDIIWSINPDNDPLDAVLARIRRFATEIFEAKEIEGAIFFPQHTESLRLDMGRRRQFFLLFKEAVNNMAKYSQCKKAEITVDCENGALLMTVADDGVGFDINALPEGCNGMKTMRDRAGKLKGTLDIQSSPGNGTKVSLRFPITEIRD